MVEEQDQIYVLSLNKQTTGQNIWNNNLQTLENRPHRTVISWKRGQSREGLRIRPCVARGEFSGCSAGRRNQTECSGLPRGRDTVGDLRRTRWIKFSGPCFQRKELQGRELCSSEEGLFGAFSWVPISTGIRGKPPEAKGITCKEWMATSLEPHATWDGSCCRQPFPGSYSTRA